MRGIVYQENKTERKERGGREKLKKDTETQRESREKGIEMDQVSKCDHERLT